MKITLSGNRTGKHKKSPLQSRFDKLRQHVERETRKNAKLQRELDDMVRSLHQIQRESTQKQLPTLVALCERLNTFSSRKSLSDWHRDELHRWIRELNVRVAAVDREAFEGLRQNYLAAQAKLHGMTVEELQREIDDYYAEQRAAWETPDPEADGDGNPFADESPEEFFEEFLQEDLFNELFGDDDRPREEEDIAAGHADRPPRPAADKAPDDAWIKDLFRRAAQALHPDREPDPERRLMKQARMKALLAARKEGDVLTLLSIYSEATGNEGLAIAEEEMARLCGMLEQQLAALQAEQAAVCSQTPDHYFAYDMLYHPSAKVREAKLAEMAQAFETEADDHRMLIDYLRNLPRLKEVLAERRHAESLRLGLDTLFAD